MKSSQLATVEHLLKQMIRVNNELGYMKSCSEVHFIYMQNTRFIAPEHHAKQLKALYLHWLEEEKKEIALKLTEYGVDYDGA